jgi:hypothetical protein
MDISAFFRARGARSRARFRAPGLLKQEKQELAGRKSPAEKGENSCFGWVLLRRCLAGWAGLGGGCQCRRPAI